MQRWENSFSHLLVPYIPGVGKNPNNYDALFSLVQFSHSVVSDSLRPPWTAACQASLSITISRSLPKLMSIESVMVLCGESNNWKVWVAGRLLSLFQRKRNGCYYSKR